MDFEKTWDTNKIDWMLKWLQGELRRRRSLVKKIYKIDDFDEMKLIISLFRCCNVTWKWLRVIQVSAIETDYLEVLFSFKLELSLWKHQMFLADFHHYINDTMLHVFIFN